MRKTIFTVATLVGLSVTGSAVSQGLDFIALDTDMSGELSFQELQMALPAITEDDFGILDVDGNGSLSNQEFAALMETPAEPAEPTIQ